VRVGRGAVGRSVATVGVVVVAALLSSACSSEVVGQPHPAPDPVGAAPATGAPRVGPDAFPSVLSTTTADTGTPATADELTAGQIVDGADDPAGFRGTTVVVSSGPGSYRLAAPSTYSVLWRAGTPADQLVAAASNRDPRWAQEFRSTAAAADPSGSLRSVMLDTGPADGVTALVVTLTPAEPESGDALADEAGREFTDEGYPVYAGHGVRVNGADGAYVEFSRPVAGGGSQAGVQVRVPDPPAGLTWGLTCEGPEPTRDDLRATCARIAGTFRPLPAVIGP
jgi:hypothetical protein